MSPATIPEGPAELVHSSLARWAIQRADQVAIFEGHSTLSFAELYARVQQAALMLEQSRAPATVLIDDKLPIQNRVIDFLATITSGRCAAVSDPDWTPATRRAVLELLDPAPASCAPPGPTMPFYVGFTSGSTGLPKGFRRDHQSWVESFRICAETFGPDACSRLMVPGRPSHSLFLFGILFGLWSGGGVVVQDRFSAAELIDTLARGDTPSLVAVPSQLLMLLELATRRDQAAMDSVRLIMISGARWAREHTPALQALFPRARIIEFYGASETSFISWMPADTAVPANVVGYPFGNVDIDIREPQEANGSGLIYVRSPMLFMDYVGGNRDATAALRAGEWISVRDVGRFDARGRLLLMGRQNRMVVTQGKNLFPEEVETVLAASPSVDTASVHGLPHPLRGQQVVAIVRSLAGRTVVKIELMNWCREHLEAYKVPRHVYVCDEWPWTASGKTDHNKLAQALEQHSDGFRDNVSPCLHRLH